jgi:hypothetical protein
LHAFNHHHHHHSERKKKESMELCCYIQKLAALEVVVVRKGRKQRVVWAHGKENKGRLWEGYVVDGRFQMAVLDLGRTDGLEEH